MTGKKLLYSFLKDHEKNHKENVKIIHKKIENNVQFSVKSYEKLSQDHLKIKKSSEK